jgi:hypothetical protein
MPARPALNAPVERGLGAIKPGRLLGWRDVLRSRNRPVGALVAQLFSQNMSGTGLEFHSFTVIVLQTVTGECRAPA